VKHLVSKSIYAKMGHPVPTKAFLQLIPDMAVMFAPTEYPLPPIPLFLLMLNLSPTDTDCQQWHNSHAVLLGRKGLQDPMHFKSEGRWLATWNWHLLGTILYVSRFHNGFRHCGLSSRLSSHWYWRPELLNLGSLPYPGSGSWFPFLISNQ